MRALLNCLLASSLLAHAVLGCCRHAAPGGAASETRLAFSAIGGCEHDHDDAPGKHGSHEPVNGRTHCHGLCSFLPGQKSQVGKCVLKAPLEVAWGDVASADIHIAAVRFTEWQGEFANGPPLRLHLLHQILLV